MKIKCFRCGKEIDTPDSLNADYIIAEDTVASEPREILFALQENALLREKRKIMAETEIVVDPETREEKKVPKYPDLSIEDADFDKVEIANLEEAKKLPNIEKVIARIENRDIQKTGIICPECYKPTDFVIWGVHKEA